MDKRVLLTVAICMGILFVWTKFFMPPAQQQSGAPTVATAPAGDGGAAVAPPAVEPRKAGEPAIQRPAEVAAPTPAEAAKPVERAPEVKDVHEEAGLYRAEFTSWGAALDSFVLLKPQFKESVVNPDGKKQPAQIDLVRTKGADLPLLVSFPQSDFSLPADTAWQKIAGLGPDELGYAYDNDQVHIEKRFTFVPKTYQVKMKVSVENKSDKPLGQHLQLQVTGKQDPNVKPPGMFSQRLAQTEGMCHVGGKLKRADLQSLLKKPIDEVGQARFVGIDEKYFVSAMAQAVAPDRQERCWVSATQEGVISSVVLEQERKVAPKSKTDYEFAGYFGPKFLDQLDSVTVAGVDAKLGDSVNYGWTEVLARPMLAVLKGVHFVIPNWGVAIILLTVLLKIITYWPTSKSMKSMREMAKCKPEVDKLKAKFGEDKQKFNVAVMALYKERGINPLGGCLPMAIQMPIYIALYSMLGNSVELYHTPFVGWIQDLTANDPYYVLPLLTGALMFAQQKLSPTPPDPQQKAMMYMMPVMFTAFSIFLPAGLTVYILTNTLLTMAQQWWLNRGEGATTRPSPAPKPTKATAKA